MQSVKVSDSHPPAVLLMLETNRLTVRWLQVCVWFYLFGSSLVEFLSLFIYASPRPPQTTHPSHRTPFFQRQTGLEFKIDTLYKCHFPAWLSLRQLVPAHSGQSEYRCQPRLGCLVSSPHRQRRLESTVSPPRFLLFSASLPCRFRLFQSPCPSMLSGMLLITCFTPSCPFCCCSLTFSLTPCVATLHARALNAGITQTEFKCTSFFLSWHLSPFS